ncbi:MAG TPA: replication-associated recombination protein A [Bacteroidia bacterium]|nr:replication-associated recombination protein A [Bacteroidia bacterium]
MQPLAERMRPKKWDEIIGQQHLVGQNGILTKFIQQNFLPSIILWGQPGVGKTTIALLLAQSLNRTLYSLSAINSGVKEVREVLEKAEKNLFTQQKSPILFIDEIHRFNKSQQDALLGAVEKGVITLIGATTENPSFEIVPALLSRMQVLTLTPLNKDEMQLLLDKAINDDKYLKQKKIKLKETEALMSFSGGDARKLLNALESVVQHSDDPVEITNELVHKVLQKTILYDKNAEQHYDVISAFIKSVRGSDIDAALYWLAVMLKGGEDPLFIARRLIILAAEDIGLANPNALLLANACFDAVHKIGMPEARIILSEVTIYLAQSPKSNSAYLSIDNALEFIEKNGIQPVPLHLRNAPTKLMKELNYGLGYKYPHDYPNHIVEQNYLPEKLIGIKFFDPSVNDKINKK